MLSQFTGCQTALKSILNSLMKNEMAEVFLYPVDSR